MPTRTAIATARRAAALCLLAAAGALLPGCAGYYYGEKYGATLSSLMRPSLLERNQQAVARLIGPDDQPTLARTQQLRVLPFTSVSGDVGAQRFSRLMSEQIAGALVQQGQRVSEGDVHGGVTAASVHGRYTVSASQVFVSLRLVQADARVAAAYDYAVPLDEDVRSLLGLR